MNTAPEGAPPPGDQHVQVFGVGAMSAGTNLAFPVALNKSSTNITGVSGAPSFMHE